MVADVLEITEENRSPLVEALLAKLEERDRLIDDLHEQVNALTEHNKVLKDEIAALKKSSKRPKFTNKSNPRPKPKSGSGAKRPGSEKKPKKANLKIDETRLVTPSGLPEGSKLKRTRSVVVQNLVVKSHNVKFVLEQWETPSGKIISGQVPSGVSQGFFGVGLCQYILHQYHHCQVTQPLLREQLMEFGIDISIGQINNILTESKDIFHDEKNEILRKGLEISEWIQTDDTGARHKGKTGYCTHIGNELFAWFGSSVSKSRINFLEILNSAFAGKYRLDELTFRYLKEEKLAKHPTNKLKRSIKKEFESKESWNEWLKDLGIVKPRHIKIATEAALFSGAVNGGMREDLIILSDDAGQFNIPLMIHALCWVHEARHIKNLVPITDKGRLAQEEALESIWSFYRSLKAYCSVPCDKQRVLLEQKFDDIFKKTTCFAQLNLAMKRIYNKKSELLVILDHPDLPGHNNGSEGDIREFVKRRKISGGTRSASGRRCRDTFASLKKTCRKLGVSFWIYLQDRLSGEGRIKSLPELMVEKAVKNRHCPFSSNKLEVVSA